MSNFFPFDENNLAGGPARVLYAPIAATAPTKLVDIYQQKSPYAPAGTDPTDWKDFGATSGPPQISRNMTTAGFGIEQSNPTVLDEVTDLTRTIAVPVAELTPEVLAMLEESSGVVTVASGTGYGSSKKIPFGSIFDLTQYRIALVYRFKKSQGLVTETSTSITRGRAAAWVGYNAKLTADNVQISVAKGALNTATLTFKLDNDASITAEGSEQGFWIIEDAGTIA